MKTESIKQVFDEYLKTSNTNYAILINGSWGSGKTYLWKNELAKMTENKGFKTIYLSLNGISKIEQLEYQLFLKLIPYLGKAENKMVKNATTLVTNLLNGFSKVFMKMGLNEVLKDVRIDGLNFSQYVIAFDDLERCQIPIKEVLGFINNYVEHKSLKTIVMADEMNMVSAIEKDPKGYDNIKEKVIGRILSYEPDLQTILPVIIKTYDTVNASYFQFLCKHSSYILNLLTEYKEQNLRVVSFYFDILEKLEPSIKNTDEKFVSEIIICTLTICLEFKKGKLVTSDSKDFKKLEDLEKFIFSIRVNESLASKLTKKEDKPPREISYAEKFYEKYLNDDQKTFFFYPSVYAFILTGYLDKNKLTEELKSRVPTAISQEDQSYKQLINHKFRHLSNETFSTLIKTVIEYARAGKYSIYDYPSIISFYSYFHKNGLVTLSEEEINSAIETGLNIAKQRKKIDSDTFGNLMHFKNENEAVEQIKLRVKEIHLEWVSEALVTEAMILINAVTNDSETELSAAFEKYRMSENLFPYLQSSVLSETIISASNKQISIFTNELEKRYNAVNIGDFLYCDYECLSTLSKNLSTHIKSRTVEQPKKYLLEAQIEVLTTICEKINKKSSKAVEEINTDAETNPV